MALLLRLRLELGGAAALALPFSVQVGFAFAFRNEEVLTIRTLTWLGWVYLALTVVIGAMNWRGLVRMVQTALRPQQLTPATARKTGAGARASE